MAETESESVREDMGYTAPDPETTKRIIEHLNPAQPETGKPDPEKGLPTTEEAAEYGIPNIEKIRRDLDDIPDHPSPSSR